MRQRRALGRAGGPRRELDVDRVVELQRRAEGLELAALLRRRGFGDVVEVEHAGRRIRPQADDELKLGQALGAEFARLIRVDFGGASPQRSEIVIVLVTRAQDQRPAAGFLHRVIEFMAPVGWIDVDKNEPGERRAELRRDPFAHIGRPDPNPIALFKTQFAQADRPGLRTCATGRRSSSAHSGGG